MFDYLRPIHLGLGMILGIATAGHSEEVIRAIPYPLPPASQASSSFAEHPPAGWPATLTGSGALRGYGFVWSKGRWHSNRPLQPDRFAGRTGQAALDSAVKSSRFPPGSHFYLNTLDYLIVSPPIASSKRPLAAVTPKPSIPKQSRPQPSPVSLIPVSSSITPREETTSAAFQPRPDSRPDGYPRIIRGCAGLPGWIFQWQDYGWRSDRPLTAQFNSTEERQKELNRWIRASGFPASCRARLAADDHVWAVPGLGAAEEAPPISQSTPVRHSTTNSQRSIASSMSPLPRPDSQQAVTCRATAGFPSWQFQWMGSHWRSTDPLRAQFSSTDAMWSNLRTWVRSSGFPRGSSVSLDPSRRVLVIPPGQ